MITCYNAIHFNIDINHEVMVYSFDKVEEIGLLAREIYGNDFVPRVETKKLDHNLKVIKRFIQTL